MSELLESLNLLGRLSQAAPAQINGLQMALQQLEASTLSLSQTTQQLQSATQAGCAAVNTKLQDTASLLEQRRQSLAQAQQASLEALQSLVRSGEQQEASLTGELAQTSAALSALLASGNGAVIEFNAATTAQLAAVASNIQAMRSEWQELEHSFTAVQSSLKSFAQIQMQVQAQQTAGMNAWNEQFSTTRANLGKEILQMRDQSQDLKSQFGRAMDELLGEFSQKVEQIEHAQADGLEARVAQPCEGGVKTFTQDAVLYLGQQNAQVEDKLLPLGVEFEKQVKRSQQGTPLKPMLVTTYYFLQKLGQDSLLAPYLELLFQNG